MTRQPDPTADWFRRCSCGGPHGLSIYVDADDGMVELLDEYPRWNDNLDLRGVWHRVRAAWWVLAGRRCSFASMVLVNDDIREFAGIMTHAADLHDQWRQPDPQEATP